MPFISLIKLSNILCHDNLEVKFTKNICVITGPNGSGKSAIMAAIGAVLGFKKTCFQRAKKWSDLIKTGQTEGEIELTINNEDYKKDYFSDVIIIKLKIKANGCDTVIKNSDGKVYSRRKGDLESIIDWFNIRLDNPLNYLTQDRSKVLLNVTNAKALYQLFMQGTGFANTIDLHEESLSRIQHMDDCISTVKGEVKKIDENIKSNQMIIGELDNVEKLEEEVEMLELEMEWALIDFKGEKALEEEVKIHTEEMGRILEAESNLENEMHDVTKQISTLTETNKKKHEQRMQEIKHAQSIVNEKSLVKREIENDLSEIVKEIDQIKKGMSITPGLDLESMKISLVNLKQRKEDGLIKIQNIQKKYEDIKNNYLQDEGRVKQVDLQLTATKRMIDDCRRMKDSTLSFFGGEFEIFLKEVKRTRFKGLIIGPLANEIKLKDPKWYRPVSTVLKGCLSAFIVYEKEDRNILQSVIKKYRMGPVSVLTPNKSNDKLIKYESNERFTTMLDVIEAPVPILNVLIILSQVERIILIEGRTDAHNAIRARPLHVECAYTARGDIVKMYGGSLADFSSNTNKFFFQNSNNRIEELQSKLLLMEKSKYNKHKEEFLKTQTHLNEVISQNEKLINETRELEIKYEAILNTQKLRDEDLGERQLITHNAQREELIDAIQEIEATIKDSQYILEAKDPTCLEDTSLNNTKLRIHEQLDHERAKRINEARILAVKVSELDLKRKNVRDKCKKLEMHGPAFNNPRNEEDLQILINTKKCKINSINKQTNKDEVLANIKDLDYKKEQKTLMINEYKNRISLITSSFNKRIKKRDEILKEEGTRAQIAFEKYTSERNYTGRLLFDHESQLLELSMSMVDGTAGNKNTLSGGERSFASTCMLMSLWPSISCPVRVLDEFDVFMDSINRQAAIKMLVDYFKKKGGQVILITPLDLFEHEDIQIHSIRPPRNTQSN